MASFTVDSANQYYSVINSLLCSKDGKTLVACPGALTSVTIPEGVTEIGSSAFESCSSLTSVTIPSSVTSIGNYAFRRCANLNTPIIIPEGITKIAYAAFSRCTNIPSVQLPSTLKSIDSYAFDYCEKLTSVTIPEGVTSIGERAFEGCSGLTSVTIPSSVTSIGAVAFSSCSRLTSVDFKGVPPSVGSNVFNNISSSATGSYLPQYASEWEAVIDANGKWNGLTMERRAVEEDEEEESHGITPTGVIGAVAGMGFEEVILMLPDDTWVDVEIEGLPDGFYEYFDYNYDYNPYRGCVVISGRTNEVGTYPLTVKIDGEVVYAFDLKVKEPLSSTPNYVGYSNKLPIGRFYEDEYVGTCTANVRVYIQEDSSLYLETYLLLPSSSYGEMSKGYLSFAPYAFSVVPQWSIVKEGDVEGYQVSWRIDSCTEQMHETCDQYCFDDYSVFSQTTRFFDDKTAKAFIFYGSDLCIGANDIYGALIPLESTNFYYSTFSFEDTISLSSFLLPEYEGSLEIPETIAGRKVVELGGGVFSGCTGLTSVTIPSSVTSVGANVFSGCTNLTSSITFNGVPLETVDSNAFTEMPESVVGYYLPEHASEWEAVIVDDKWNGLTMKLKEAFSVITYTEDTVLSGVIDSTKKIEVVGCVLDVTSVTISGGSLNVNNGATIVITAEQFSLLDTIVISQDSTLKLKEERLNALLTGKVIVNHSNEVTLEGGIIVVTPEGEKDASFTTNTNSSVITFKAIPTITGRAWWWDYEFNGNGDSIGRDAESLQWDNGRPYMDNEYTEPDAQGNQMLKLPSRPWRDVHQWPNQSTFVMYCKAGNSADGVLASFGSSAYGVCNAITLMTGQNPERGDMRLCYSNGGRNATKVDLVNNFSVPDAIDSYHLYAFVVEHKNKSTQVSVYVDGELLATYLFDSIITLGPGFQIASVHGGCPDGLNRLAVNDTATMDFLRVTDEVLSADAMKALANAFPYISKNGSATRSLASNDEDKNWITSQPIWQQTTLAADGTGETVETLQTKPNSGTNLKLFALDNTSMTLNLEEDVAYESLSITGAGSVQINRGHEATQMLVSGHTLIATDVTIDTNVIKFGALSVAEGKTLTFDFSAYDFSQVTGDTFIPLTGLLTGEGEVKVVFPAETPGNVMGLTSYKDLHNNTYGIFVSVVGEINSSLRDNCAWNEMVWTVDSAEINNLNWENAILTTKIMVDTDVELDIDEVVALKALKLKGQGNLTICIKENGAFKPNTIDDSEYEGELRFVIEQGAKQTYFLGSERNVYNGDYLPFLSYETEVLSGGEIGFTYEGTCYSLMNADFSKLTGNGLISFDSLYVGDMNWAVLPSNCFAETLQLKNDSDILLQPVFNESNPLSIRNLSGNGRFRSDAFTGGERCLKVTQTKNSIFSGYFVANDNSSYLNREICLCVSSDAADADYSLKRLILSGDSDLGENSELSGFATLRDSKGTLTIEKSGALELNYIWGGDGIIAGVLGGNGGFASDVTFMTGARIVLPKDGELSIAGRVIFGENLIVQSDTLLDEPKLVLDFLNSAVNQDVLNTRMTLCVDGVVDEYAQFILTEDGLYVIPSIQGLVEPMVRFDVGNHGHRIGGGRLVQFPAHQTEIIPPTINADDGWVFVGWDVSLNSLVSGGQATAQYKTLKPDLHVRDVVVQAAAQTGEAIEINWTLSNTGNPNWEGKLVEQIRLVNVANPENKVVIADIVEDVTVVRDGETDRSYIWNIPLKGLVGEWIVEVETAIGCTTEHGGENTGVSASTVIVTQAPLPELSVKSIKLDREAGEYLPQDAVTVRYVVQNTGTATATAPWQDRLYLFKNGTRITLATREETASLEAGAEVEREITCKIPELIALSGEVSFVVKTDYRNSIVELEDAEAESTPFEDLSNAVLGKRLYLSFVTDAIDESASGTRFYIKRSGEMTAALPVTLSATGSTSSVTYPTSLTINAGTNVTAGMIAPVDNLTVDGTRQITFVVAAINDEAFVTEAKTFNVLDNEVPALTLSFDKTMLREGEGVIVVTVTRELVTDEPLLVYLSGVQTSQCTYPTKVEIPAGEASYTFELGAVNNTTAEVLADLSLRASAVGYVTSEQTFTVEDDDVPSVTLTIYPTEVSEGAGVNAAYAELARVNEDEIGSPITINLTSSLPNQILLPTTVTIPAYTKVLRFAIGTIDNGIDDGDREVKVTGAIYIESCGCSSQPSSGDVIEANLRIIDNDGPALSLVARPSTMKEGLEDAGELILKHNSTLSEDLVVALSVDTVGEVEIPQSVVIPAGETSICIPVKTLDDGETDGGKLVSIYANDESGVFASASTWLQVSDQNLPDLKVEKIEVSTGILAGKPIDGAFNLSNIGFVPCNFDVMYSVHLVDAIKSESATEKNKICSGVISEKILPGTLNVIHFTGQPSMVAGDYRIIVQLNQNGAVAELDKVNNTLTSDVFTIMAAYDVTVMAERETYLQKENILLKGMVTTSDKNMALEGLPVVVTILHNGYARTFDIRTGAQGTFTCMFNPSPSESGNYVVMAAAPGVTQKQPQDEFDILGIELVDKSPLVWDNAVVGSTHEWNVLIRNTSNTPLTNLIINQQNVSKTCSIECTLPNMLEGNEVVPLTIKMMALAHSQNVATRSGYEEITLSISSAEGGQLEIPLYFFGITQQASLVLNPMKLDSTMVKNETRYLSFVIKNEGMGDSGEIKVEIPSNDWMSVVGGKNIKNLKQGEEGVVTLALAPLSDGMIVNREYSGTMAVRCENGPDCELPFAFLLTSEKRATLKLDVVNVLTFTVDGKPHVEGAKVTLYDVYGKVLDVAETDKTGICLFEDVMEGQYTLSIEAKKHNSKKIEVNVLPGIVNEKTVFLDYQSVEYTWKVVPTEIEDQYEVKLEMEYETNVPYPVVIIHVPEAIPSLAVGEAHVAEITLENKGLVALQDVYFDLDDPTNILERAGYEYEQLSPDIKILPALSSETVFVRFTKSMPTKNEGVQLFDALEDLENLANKVGFDCAIGTKIEGVFLCGEEFLEYYERSPDIKIKDALCNLSYYLLNALSDLLRDWLPSTSVVRRGDGPSSVEVTQKNPIISEGDACEQYLNYLHRLSSAYLSSNRIFDYAYKGIQLVEGKNIDLLVDLFFDVAPEINSDKPFAKIVEWMGTYRSLRSEFDELAAEYENLPMKKAKEMLERLEVYYQIAERILDAADVFFGSPKWYVGNNVVVLLKYLQEKKASANVLIADDDLEYFALENSLDGVSREDLVAFKRRWNSISSMSQLVQLFSSDEIDGSVITALRENFEALKIMLQENGYSSVEAMRKDCEDQLTKMLEGGDVLHICSKVTLELSQTMAMTREAFIGTLGIQSSEFGKGLENVMLELCITDVNGVSCNEYFGISDKSMSGFVGTSILNATASLEAGALGEASVLFVPTNEAAPEHSQVYYFGGVLKYYDIDLQKDVSVKLSPIPLQVNPSPILNLDYFIQRDVYGDDPFTEDVVEPSMPAEFAVLVRNTGYGDAKNVRIDTVQPKVIENTKGVAIDFELKDYIMDASALNGVSACLPLQNVNLGTIESQKNAVAQWWFTSSLEGHFSGVKATLTHLNSWGESRHVTYWFN